jgi:hypothetical protein
LVCEAEEITGKFGYEAEDVVACSGAEDEEGDDELDEHAYDDGVPFDVLAGTRCGVEDGDQDQQAEKADCAVCAGVVFCFFADE